MKLFLSTPFCILLLSVAALVVVVESSHNVVNITRGSSLSTSPSSNQSSNCTSYWLSPSGNIAFGFYPLCSKYCRFIVGIWLVKSADKTLVWTANRDDPPFYHPSSILFNNDGKFVVRTAYGREKPLLLDVWEPAFYAAMLDNGNFVLYGSTSQVIWESFDYPTDTILGGQELTVGQSLVSSVSRSDHSSGIYTLKIQQDDGQLVKCWKTEVSCEVLMLNRGTGEDVSALVNLDPSMGRLYLDENQQQLQQEPQRRVDSNVLYRAILGTDGVLYLYKDRIGCENEKSILIWESEEFVRWEDLMGFLILGFRLLLFNLLVLVLARLLGKAYKIDCLLRCLEGARYEGRETNPKPKTKPNGKEVNKKGRLEEDKLLELV